MEGDSCAREERCTDSHSYKNRRHVVRAFTDDKCEIPGMLSCVHVKKGGNALKELLTLSGTQRYLGCSSC